MTHKTIRWGAVVSCVAIVALLGSYAHGEKSAAVVEHEVEDFGDGIVMIQIERTVGLERYSDTSALRDAKLIKRGERYFIRGIGYVAKANENDRQFAWIKDIDAAYAWDGVASFFVFTPEQFENHVANLKQVE
jgi:hypothetical protein